VFIPLIQLLLDQLGWRGALMVLGGINLVLCAGLYWAVIDPAADTLVSDDKASTRPPADGRSTLGWALGTPVFWALAVAFTAYVATFTAFTFHLYPLLLERGFDTGMVVTAMMLIGPAQVAGRIAIWVFASHASIRAIGSVIVIAFPLAPLALEILPPGFALIAAVCIIYGAGNGIMTIVRGMAVPEMLTRDAYGAINGALAAPGMVARALAPVGAAMLWTATGSYEAVVWAIIGSSVVTVVSFWAAATCSRSTAP
jgi:predicted MFS family arabinose efflux permease